MHLKSLARLALSTVLMGASVFASAQSKETTKLDPADRQFLMEAAYSGNAEIQSSQLAVQRARRPEIKEFAQKMVEDHTKASQELTALASAKGLTAPSEPSKQHAKTIKELTDAKDADFDRRYAREMGVKAHKDTVKLFEKAASNSKDQEVKAFAAKTLPTLRHHLEMAEKLPEAK